MLFRSPRGHCSSAGPCAKRATQRSLSSAVGLVVATFACIDRGKERKSDVIVRMIDRGGVSIRKYEDQRSSESEKNASKKICISR